MTDREAMKQALEALGWTDEWRPDGLKEQAITALRERLAQPEQEPVAWVTGWHDGHCVIRAADPALILPIGAALYTTPPQRKPEQEPIKESSVTHSHLWIGDLYGKEKNT